MKWRASLSCLVIAILYAVHGQATTPEQAVVEYSAAVQSEGLPALVRFTHPDELERFKQMLLPAVRADKKVGPYAWRELLFGGGTTIAQAESKTGAEYLAALLQTIGTTVPSFKMGELTVLGSVHEGELVHVVTRGAVEALGMKNTKVEVVSVKPYGDGWKVLLSSDIEGFTTSLVKGP